MFWIVRNHIPLIYIYIYINGSKSSKQNQKILKTKETPTTISNSSKQQATAYKHKLHLNPNQLKKQEIIKVKVDLTKININTLTTTLDLLSDELNVMMILPSSNRYYASNNRTINLLMKGKIDMDAVTGEVDAPKFSDAEIRGLLEQGTGVSITVVKHNDTTNKTRWCFLPISK